MRTKTVILPIAAALLLTVLCTEKPLPPTSTANDELRTDPVTATFDPGSDKVNVSWTAPVSSVRQTIGYRIYSAWGTAVAEEDFSAIDTIIPAGVASFQALPGVGDGIYHYKVAALWLHPLTIGGVVVGADTVEGALSYEDTAHVRTTISGGMITINNGASHTMTRTVSITLTPLENFTSCQVLDSGAVESIAPSGNGVAANPIANVVLDPGSGTKEVYVRATKLDQSQIILKSFIKIQPYICKLVVRNADLRKAEGVNGKLTSQKNVQFSVQIYGDSTFSESCYVWVATSGAGKALLDTSKDLVETAPHGYRLNTLNEDTVFEYNVADPASYTKCVYTTPAGKNLANRRPGAWYGGKDSVGFTATGYAKGSLFYLSDAIQNDELYKMGLKEFYVMARLKGKHFNDDRYVWSKITESTLYNWDFYPPAVYLRASDKVYTNPTPVPNDTVTGPIDVVLTPGQAVKDRGRSYPPEIRLYFAQTTKDPAAITLGDILSSRHIVYSMPFNTDDWFVKKAFKGQRIDGCIFFPHSLSASFSSRSVCSFNS